MTYLELNNKYNMCDPPPDITYVCSFGLHLCLIGNVPGMYDPPALQQTAVYIYLQHNTVHLGEMHQNIFE